MKKIIIIALVGLLMISGGYYLYINRPRPPVESKFVPALRSDDTGASNGQEKFVDIKTPPESVNLGSLNHTYQTFNNCGPATLSMALGWFGKNVSQKELGDQMRPYQIANGDNDDKTIFTYEFVDWAKKYGLEAIARPNGDIETLKNFTANGIPVVVKTWLHPNEDIGHFRIVKGYDEARDVIIQDDSFEGPNREIRYYDFLSMWQPFNYVYIVVYTKEQTELVNAIIGEELEESMAWQNALKRGIDEEALDSTNVYPMFNISVASYQLGEYQASIDYFEKVESRLPKRMLWYQIEPIQAYQALEQYDRVFDITNRILENGNRAFSELYQIRGEIFKKQGNIESAKAEYDKAVFYNKNNGVNDVI